MTKFFTVYFDTQFYIRLANADETLASKTIDELNSLQVRHVLSQTIFFELLKKSTKPEKDKILVERMNRFVISPYIVKSSFNTEDSNLSWDILLLSGQEREFLSNFLTSVRDLQTLAESISIAIPRNSEQKKKLSNTSLDLLEEFGVLENKDLFKNQDFAEGLKTAMNVLNQIIPVAENLPKEMFSKFEEMNLNKDVNDKNAANIAQQLFDVVGKENLGVLKSHEELKKSVTKNEDRPFKVAVSEASKNEVKNLGNTLGDTEHMLSFAINKNEIDILQIDIPQSKILENNPSHKFVEMNLNNRCFTAKSLEETVEKVANIKGIFQR
jgi:hypothetical protein